MLKLKLFKLKNRKGFTLIEFIISMAIFAVMMIICTDIIIRLVRVGENADIRAEMLRNIQYVSETMKRTIRDAPANSITNCSGSTCTVNSIKYSLQSAQNGNQTVQEIVQTSINGSGASTSDPILLTNNTISVSLLNFNYVGGYVEIKIQATDLKQAVYKDSAPYSIITGALSTK